MRRRLHTVWIDMNVYNVVSCMYTTCFSVEYWNLSTGCRSWTILSVLWESERDWLSYVEWKIQIERVEINGFPLNAQKSIKFRYIYELFRLTIKHTRGWARIKSIPWICGRVMLIRRLKRAPQNATFASFSLFFFFRSFVTNKIASFIHSFCLRFLTSGSVIFVTARWA